MTSLYEKKRNDKEGISQIIPDLLQIIGSYTKTRIHFSNPDKIGNFDQIDYLGANLEKQSIKKFPESLLEVYGSEMTVWRSSVRIFAGGNIRDSVKLGLNNYGEEDTITPNNNELYQLFGGKGDVTPKKFNISDVAELIGDSALFDILDDPKNMSSYNVGLYIGCIFDLDTLENHEYNKPIKVIHYLSPDNVEELNERQIKLFGDQNIVCFRDILDNGDVKLSIEYELDNRGYKKR